jgi:hypothetical protein
MPSVSYAVDVSGNQPAHQPWGSFGAHVGIAKATEGQHTRDAWFARHIADIKAAGLIPGAYHFAWPSQDPFEEAANYVEAVLPFNAGPFLHFLDLERNPSGENWTGTTARKRTYANAWIAAVKKAFPQQRVLVYLSGESIAAGILPGNQDGIWYPAYPVQGRTFAQAAAATRPDPSGHTVWGWQFASVPRDQTVIYMSPAALRAWAAGTPEDDMPLTAADAKTLLDTRMDDPTKPGTETVTVRGALWAAYGQANKAAGNTTTLLTQVTALSATVKTLAGLVGSEVDTATVVNAVEEAIATAVVHVQVDVTGGAEAS